MIRTPQWWEFLPNARPTGFFHATWEAPGEFFSGIETGDRVSVHVRFNGANNPYTADIQKLGTDNACLSIPDTQFDRLTNWIGVGE